MSYTIMREIEKLATKVNFKYSSILGRVNQLEQDQVGSLQVLQVISLIGDTNSIPIEYTATPNHFTPIYVVPIESN